MSKCYVWICSPVLRSIACVFCLFFYIFCTMSPLCTTANSLSYNHTGSLTSHASSPRALRHFRYLPFFLQGPVWGAACTVNSCGKKVKFAIMYVLVILLFFPVLTSNWGFKAYVWNIQGDHLVVRPGTGMNGGRGGVCEEYRGAKQVIQSRIAVMRVGIICVFSGACVVSPPWVHQIVRV